MADIHNTGLNLQLLTLIEAQWDNKNPAPPTKDPNQVANPDHWKDFDLTGDGKLDNDDLEKMSTTQLTDLVAYLNETDNVPNDSALTSTLNNFKQQANDELSKSRSMDNRLGSFLPKLGIDLRQLNLGGLTTTGAPPMTPTQALSSEGLKALETKTPEQRTKYHQSLNVLISTLSAQVQGGNASPATKASLDALRELRSKFEAKFPANSDRYEGFDLNAIKEKLTSSNPNEAQTAQNQLRSLYATARESLEEAESKGDQPAADAARAKMNEIFSSVAGVDPSKLPPELRTASFSIAFDPASNEGKLLNKFDLVGGDHKITPADLAKMSPAELTELAGLLTDPNNPQASSPTQVLSPETNKQLFHLIASFTNDSKNNWNGKGGITSSISGTPPTVKSLTIPGSGTIPAPEGPQGWELPPGINSGDPVSIEQLLSGLPV